MLGNAETTRGRVVIQEQDELRITADFWDDARGEEPAVIRFPGKRSG